MKNHIKLEPPYNGWAILHTPAFTCGFKSAGFIIALAKVAADYSCGRDTSLTFASSGAIMHLQQGANAIIEKDGYAIDAGVNSADALKDMIACVLVQDYAWHISEHTENSIANRNNLINLETAL